MRRIFSTCACFLAIAGFIPAASQAQQVYQDQSYIQASASDIPLVVIRFNQDRVLYEHQLYNAIAKAVEIKPSVVFDVVSFVPKTGNRRKDEKIASHADQETSKVVGSLRKMGIPQARMHVTNESAPNLRYHEVHVYVE